MLGAWLTGWLAGWLLTSCRYNQPNNFSDATAWLVDSVSQRGTPAGGQWPESASFTTWDAAACVNNNAWPGMIDG